MKVIFASLLLIATPGAAAPATQWVHVGNTYNSSIFVDRAVLRESGSKRRFRTLHINVQTSAGWRAAEHRGTIDCAARTLFYEGVIITESNGSRKTLPSAVAKPVRVPAKGVMRTLADSICTGKLGPSVSDPDGWTKKNFRPA